MAQIEQGGGDGKKKKGAQKKMQIHVDFTPMVDMNMLLITFFMLCTTMIKSQTLSVILPAKPDENNTEQSQKDNTKVNEKQLITLVLETERDDNGNVVKDGDGKTKNTIYYYVGYPAKIDANGNLTSENPMKVEKFIGNDGNLAQGIRKILAERNADILTQVNEQKQLWRDKKISKEEFQKEASRIMSDKEYEKSRPIVSIKPADDAAWEAVISALDEMQINSISVYQIESIKPEDEAMVKDYKANHPE